MTEQQRYKRFIDNCKDYIEKFERIKPKSKQMFKDYQSCLKEVNWTFEKWKEEENKRQNVAGVCLK